MSDRSPSMGLGERLEDEPAGRPGGVGHQLDFGARGALIHGRAGRHVGGGRHADDHGVEQAADTDVVGGAGHHHGEDAALDHALLERGELLLDRELLAVQVLLDERVVERGHRLDQRVAGRLGFRALVWGFQRPRSSPRAR